MITSGIQPGTGLANSPSKLLAHQLGTGFSWLAIVRTEVIRLVSYITKLLNLESELGK